MPEEQSLDRPLLVDDFRRVVNGYWTRHKVILLIVSLGLIMRGGILLWYLISHDWRGETWEYEEIARNLVSGRGFTYQYHNTTYYSLVVPVFPLICAFLHLIGGASLVIYYLFHLSVAAGVIWMTYMIGSRWYGERIGILASLFVALEPGLIIYHSYKVDVIALATLIILVSVHATIILEQNCSWRLGALVGVITGVGILTRADLIVLPIASVAWVLIARRCARQAYQAVGATLLTAVIIISPWVIRNYFIHDRVAFLSTVSGEWLWRGNNPNATGTTVTLDLKGQFEAAPEAFQRSVLSLSEIEQHAFFRQEALDYIMADPRGFLARVFAKAYYFWWFTPTFARQYYEWVSSSFLLLYKALYFCILLFALAGVWYGFNERCLAAGWVTLYLASIPIMIGAIHSIAYVEGRHRMLIMPLLLILAAHGATRLGRFSFKPQGWPHVRGVTTSNREG